ncbi:ROK family protein [Blautia schinkii]|nr:ROK family protein [Blautia schinkii]
MRQEIVLGIDLGGTKLLIGEIDNNGNVLRSERYPTPLLETKTPQTAINKVLQIVSDYLQKFSLHPGVDFSGIGMGMVGRVDPQNGQWLAIAEEDSAPASAAEILSKYYGVPAAIDNDVRCGLAAELVFGSEKGCKNLIYLNIGTGIAAGFIIDGKVLNGAHFFGGEIGHLKADPHSEAYCTCGERGCVEAIASGIGLHTRAERLSPDYPDTKLRKAPDARRYQAKDIFALYDEDALCRRLTDEAVAALAITIGNLACFSDPEKIILGGGIMNNQMFFEHVMKSLPQNSTRFLQKKIVRSELDCNYIGLIGAGALMIQHNIMSVK